MAWEHTIGTGPGAVVVPCRGRLDFAAGPANVDLKSTLDASPEGFGKQAFAFKMHVQAAFYSDGYEKAAGQRKPYVLVAVENRAPFVVQTYRVSEALIEAGRETYVQWLERLCFCRETSTWPAYWEGESELALPPWALSRREDEDLSGLGLEFHAPLEG